MSTDQDYQRLLDTMVVQGDSQPSILRQMDSTAVRLGIAAIGSECFEEAVSHDELLAAGLSALDADDLSRAEIVIVLIARLIEMVELPSEPAAQLLSACKLLLLRLDAPVALVTR
jgi:hypothetical protein